MEQQNFKRNVAYKLRIGSLLSAKPILENDRLKHLDLNNKQVIRINLIGNIVDKYIQEGEKKFGSITIDDGSGQIKVKSFGDDIDKFTELQQGDTVIIIGLARSWNNEIYLTPEIIKKKDSTYLLVRKLESDLQSKKTEKKEDILALREKITSLIKDSEKSGGIEIEKIILESKESKEVINLEIKKLLEEGVAYEPRPGKIRWLG